MGKIKLLESQRALFINFLVWACKEEPNSPEWDDQYLLLRNLNKDRIKKGMLKASRDEAWAIHNYFQLYVIQVFEKRLGADLFKEAKALFILIHNELCKSKHPYFIFIPTCYKQKPIKKTIA
jgi:hypothetical protein